MKLLISLNTLGNQERDSDIYSVLIEFNSKLNQKIEHTQQFIKKHLKPTDTINLSLSGRAAFKGYVDSTLEASMGDLELEESSSIIEYADLVVFSDSVEVIVQPRHMPDCQMLKSVAPIQMTDLVKLETSNIKNSSWLKLD
ncbi:TPA: hypothetical protein I7730_00650 [Vibrio vulnificus]|uniref:Uncharacterized protein n=1 Tax=Vibrio vulnificus TaxID=672 RepID=A0A8H9K6E8_VIBVL|nr:hypothetical protein [Vibrio vulnificus]HAS8538308.1 hypothetical protein [Vibrio vulnificus]